jgi:hypothetical protein
MELSVEPDVVARLPGVRLAVVVAHEADDRAERPAVPDARARVAAATATWPRGSVSSHPRVR